MLKIIRELLLKIVDNIDAGNSNLSEDEALHEIVTELKELQPDKETFEKLERNLMNSELDTGFIYSSFYKKFSLIVIHKASSIGEFINTIEHEKNHLEMHICEALDINPYSEEAAILSGDTAMQMLNEALCNIAEL